MLKNFKPVSLILCAGALCFSGSMYANIAPVEQGASISQQNGKVTGTVEDDFGPVTGASVVVKGTTNGTITDMDGNFTLEAVSYTHLDVYKRQAIYGVYPVLWLPFAWRLSLG